MKHLAADAMVKDKIKFFEDKAQQNASIISLHKNQFHYKTWDRKNWPELEFQSVWKIPRSRICSIIGQTIYQEDGKKYRLQYNNNNNKLYLHDRNKVLQHCKYYLKLILVN